MLQHLLAPQNLPFAVALLMTLGLGLIEIVTALFGATLSSMLDAALPDFELGAPPIDVGGAVDGATSTGADLATADAQLDGAHTLSALGHALDWLYVGRVPTLVLLLTLFGSFGTYGLLLQSLASGTFGALAPSWLMAIPAFALAIPSVRLVGSMFARLIPREESSAVSINSFIGQPALVVHGVATRGNPTQAKLTDRHGQTHYVLVEPEVEGAELVAGTTVILMRREGVVFRAVINDVPELTLGRDAR